MNKLSFCILISIAIWSFASVRTSAQVDEIVRNFLKAYSSSLLYGSYEDHANLFSDPTYFEGTKYSRAGIRKVAKNFYTNFYTTYHKFEVYSYEYYESDGSILIMAVEYQTTMNRKTGKSSSMEDMKRIDLIYQNGWKCFSKIHASLR